jgi:hypothetical protein
MKLVAFGEPDFAVLSIGQQANGIVAIGQIAHGVIAIGQLARGVVVVGQLAVGLVGLGQCALTPVWGAGMIGLGGRGKWGVVRLLPWRAPVRQRPMPALVDPAAILDGSLKNGWVDPGSGFEALIPYPTLSRNESVGAAFVHREERAAGEGDFRTGAPPIRTLVATAFHTVREGTYIPSGFSDHPIGVGEFVVRLFVWVCVLGTALAIVSFGWAE